MGFLRRLLGGAREGGGAGAADAGEVGPEAADAGEVGPGAADAGGPGAADAGGPGTADAGGPGTADAELSVDEAERAHELELARQEAARLDELQQRQLRFADYAWTPPAQGGEKRADDEGRPTDG